MVVHSACLSPASTGTPGFFQTTSWRPSSGSRKLKSSIEPISVSAAKEDQKELIETATERARLDIISAKSAAERIEQELAKMSRERLLPDVKTLEKVARYEAHLSRLFHKALHELEAMQTRRSGAVAPLAWLDVDGLPYRQNCRTKWCQYWPRAPAARPSMPTFPSSEQVHPRDITSCCETVPRSSGRGRACGHSCRARSRTDCRGFRPWRRRTDRLSCRVP